MNQTTKVLRERYRYLSTAPSVIDLLRSGATLKYKSIKIKIKNKSTLTAKINDEEYNSLANNIELFKLINIIDNGSKNHKL